MLAKFKTGIISLCSIIVIGVLSVFAFIPLTTPTIEGGNKWMAKIDDTTLVNELSIPGTHNSGATHSLFDVAGICQTVTIEKQLNMGVRFFDIRLKNVNGSFTIVHEFVDQKLTLDSVLNNFVAFLKENPSEFLLISIRKESDNVNSDIDFETLLIQYYDQYGSDIINRSNELPVTLKEARGKIHLISRYKNSTVGVPSYDGWKDNTSFTFNNIYVQDHYCIDDVNEKIDDIKKTLELSKNNKDLLYINFTSCYIDVPFPPTYAITPSKDINPFVEQYLTTFNGSTGVMAMDFVNQSIITKVIERNNDYVK